VANFYILHLYTAMYYYYYYYYYYFNVTTLRLVNGMANPSVCLSVVCDVRSAYSGGLTFHGYFCTIL